MSLLKAFGIIATGTFGILVAGLLISSMFKLGWEWLFALSILIFIVAGASALILRSRH